MPTVPPRLTLFFILRGSLESGSLENGSLENGSLENGSLENGSLEPPKRYVKKISCGRR
jgi:hypothetical protein